VKLLGDEGQARCTREEFAVEVGGERVHIGFESLGDL
jgi:hypothetical protein